MAEKVKKPFYKKWWVWLLAVIIIGSIASGRGEEDATPKKIDSKAKATETAAAPEKKKEEVKKEAKKDVFAVGEAVQLGKNVLTVAKVEKSNGTELDTPQQGKEYIIVTVQIQNAGDQNISYNPFDFKMANSQGQIQDMGFTTVDSDTSLQSGELAPGDRYLVL
ncbi:DUF4352 domain-containing protein [Neobacillus sp. PS2-9]|uniref:DUF4352 domain-containing protein n=1 Tax=Neobacillus sp. PS2-9 TaxID=3070676 RepID=UPI0027DF14BA|nr:DUF4352 domain-containing protein [Neobacillus sp. PS2-9]WML56676.1 DUF4352 domain-containing protein [Neobacillus sp. PS2-9]